MRELADGSLVIDYRGKQYRGLTGAQLDKVEVTANTLTTCKANETRYQQLIELATKDVTIANQQRDIERQRFVSTMALYEKERELRREAMQFAPVSGTPKGFGGWLLKAVNSPYGAVGFKLLMPTAQFIKTMRQ